MIDKNIEQDTNELHVEWLDNGVVVRQPKFEIYKCEKFSNNGKVDDAAIHGLFGRLLWEDIHLFCNEHPCNKFKINITIKEEK